MPETFRRDLLAATVAEIADSGEFILRAYCAELESALGERTVVTASVPAGLLLVLTAAGVGPAYPVHLADGVRPAVAGVLRRLNVALVSVEEADCHIADHPDDPDQLLVTRAGRPGVVVIDLGPSSRWAGVTVAAAVRTSDADLAERVRWLRNHGQDGRTRFLHQLVGFNARMDEIAAAYLLRVHFSGEDGRR